MTERPSHLTFLVGSALAAALGACAPALHTVTACAPTPPATATRFEPAQAPALAGHYRVWFVNQAAEPEAWFHATLELWANDSVRRYRYARGGPGRWPGERPLGGAIQFANDAHDPRLPWRSRDPERPGVQLVRDKLWLGAVDVLDAGGEELTITATNPTGFWGTWRTVRGISLEPEPSPSGYFCATRASGA